MFPSQAMRLRSAYHRAARVPPLRERGTLENLLATPVRPLEMMIGKILPCAFIGYVQVIVVFGAARRLFGVPMAGSFAVATLAVGFTFSTIARSMWKGVAWHEVWPDAGAIVAFTVVVGWVAMLRYRQTID